MRFLLSIWTLAWVFLLMIPIQAFSSPSFILSKSEFREIKKIASEIAKACPEEDCIIVGIGRSVTPFQAWMELNGKKNVINLPLSNFRYRLNGKTQLEQDKEPILFQHFKQFLPLDEIKNRKVLLVDYSDTGQSILAAKEYIGKYLTQNKMTNALETWVISKKEKVSRIQKLTSGRVTPLTDNDDLSHSFHIHFFDPHSKYGEFDVKVGVELRREPRAEYVEFLKEMKRIQDQEELRQKRVAVNRDQAKEQTCTPTGSEPQSDELTRVGAICKEIATTSVSGKFKCCTTSKVTSTSCQNPYPKIQVPENQFRSHPEATTECRRRGYDGYRFSSGEIFPAAPASKL